jgi:hypothetical protein
MPHCSGVLRLLPGYRPEYRREIPGIRIFSRRRVVGIRHFADNHSGPVSIFRSLRSHSRNHLFSYHKLWQFDCRNCPIWCCNCWLFVLRFDCRNCLFWRHNSRSFVAASKEQSLADCQDEGAGFHFRHRRWREKVSGIRCGAFQRLIRKAMPNANTNLSATQGSNGR